MTFTPCVREKEVAELLHSGHWPAASSPELRAHVNACRNCADFLLVTQTLQHARGTSVRSARLNSPGLLWWRAQLRRRNDALEQVAKPIAGAHVFALIVTLLVAGAFVVEQSRRGVQWISWLTELSRSRAFHLDPLWSSASTKIDWNAMFLMPGLATLMVLSGLLIYLATDRS